MDFLFIFRIFLYSFFAFSAAFGIFRFVKLFVLSSREGIVAVKYKCTVFTVILFVMIAAMFYFSVQQFETANGYKETVALLEPGRGTAFVEEFAKIQENKKGIIILDPYNYYEDYISTCKNNENLYNQLGVYLLLIGIDSIVGLLGHFIVITENGYRIRGLKDAIPVYAEIDSFKNQIKIKVVDLTGKVQEICKFKNTPKNLASLGQFIKQEELETQEEKQ